MRHPSPYVARVIHLPSGEDVVGFIQKGVFIETTDTPFTFNGIPGCTATIHELFWDDDENP